MAHAGVRREEFSTDSLSTSGKLDRTLGQYSGLGPDRFAGDRPKQPSYIEAAAWETALSVACLDAQVLFLHEPNIK